MIRKWEEKLHNFKKAIWEIENKLKKLINDPRKIQTNIS